MPGGYTIDQTRSLVLSRAWGVLVDGDLRAHVRALAADPRFKPHFRQVSDFRDVIDYQVSVDVVKELVHLSPFGAGAQRALVMGTDVGFGLARMFQILREQSPDEVEVFRDMDAALQWLDLAGAKEELLAVLSQVQPLSESTASG